MRLSALIARTTLVARVENSPLRSAVAPGFQDEAKRVWYRNVRIKELK